MYQAHHKIGESRDNTTFLLSAMVGQHKMRLALILNAIDPSIGGVLICGRRGTGKSTAVRALTNLLPPIMGVADCPYFCDPNAPQWMCSSCQVRYKHKETFPIEQRPVPLVTLPLNASEDRVAGSFDLATALATGSSHFAPGLLAAANRGFLYIDEINLLNDHIVDLLLDAAALGVNRVERDAISIAHPAHFVLIGTMNPEEGLLRSQLLDRIGLYVDVEDLRDPQIRAMLVERRLAYDASPAAFSAQWAEAERALLERIKHAQQFLPSVHVSTYFRQVIALLVDRQLHAQGHRGDLVVLRTARALAAWENRIEVQLSDIEQAVELALPHRARAGTAIVQQLTQVLDQLPTPTTDVDIPEEIATIDDDIDVDKRGDEREGAAGLTRRLRGDQDVVQVQALITVARDRLARQEAGRRFLSLTTRRSGRFTRSRQAKPVTDIAFAATIRAAAPHQQSRGRNKHSKLELRPEDLRQKVRERKTRSLVIFVVDGSDSVMARQLMPRTKRILLALLQNAYEKRDRVAMLVFRFAQGRVVLPPTRNFTRARRGVEELYIGGCTPLATGLLEGLRLAETERLRDPTTKPILIILTDGLANIDLSGNMRRDTPHRDALNIAYEIAAHRVPTVMIDTNPYPTITNEAGEKVPSPCPELAQALAADYYQYCLPQDTTLLRKG
jgi:magnesium chelatase subunit D